MNVYEILLEFEIAELTYTLKKLKSEHRESLSDLKSTKGLNSHLKGENEFYRGEVKDLRELLDGNAEVCADLIRELRGEK